MSDQARASQSLVLRISKAPKLADARAARSKLADLDACEDLQALLADAPALRDLLLGIADHSAFLWRLIRQDPQRLLMLLALSPDHALDRVLRMLRDECDAAASEADAMKALRMAKQAAALLIALADLGGVWDVAEVTLALSQFADAAVSGALRYLLRAAAREGKLVLRDAQDPEAGCGVVVIAMGKHGAFELN